VSAVHREAQRLAAPAALTLSMSVRGRVRLVPTVVCDVALSFTHEAITNVVQHANARRVRVSVAFTSKRFRLTVSDDGSGLRVSRDDQRGADHFGLVGIRERASSIGAAFRVSSVPGGGTTLRLDAPIPV
jgi:signal transduction histidine kinase